jgi:hypothetical protein
MSLSNYTVVFDTVTGSPTEGTIAVSAVVPVSVTADFYLEIVDPSGATIKSTDTGGAAELSGGNATLDFPVVDLPLDSRGAYLKGAYVINVYVKNQDSGGGANPNIITDTLTYSFCPISSQANPNVPTLTAKVNCLTGKLVVTDTTNIQGLSVADYLLTVTPPTVPGVILSGGTTTQKSLTISLSYTNVSYTASIQGTGTRVTESDDFTITELLSMVGFITIPIECNSLCDLISCAKEQLDTLETRGTAAGGMSKLSEADLTLYLKINSLLSQIGAAQICNACDLEALVDALSELVGCDCGCGDSNVPMRLVTLCNSAAGVTNPFQKIDGAGGSLLKDTQYLLWEALDGGDPPVLALDITMLEVDRMYHIAIPGDYAGLYTITSLLENIYYQQFYPVGVDSVAFSTSGGLMCHLWVNNGKIHFTNQ